MTNEYGLAVAEQVARNMDDTGRVLEELEKCKIPDVRKRILKVLGDRSACPECGNDMLFDEENTVLYCPIDGELFNDNEL